jgi:AcrR family transcriptional regulator
MDRDGPVLGAAGQAAHTRAHLRRAYLDLLEKGKVRSAGDVADHAGVNRSSFYTHFQSVGELAVDALREELEPTHDENLLRLEAGGAVVADESNRHVIRRIVDLSTAGHGALSTLLSGDRAFGEWAFGRILNGYVQDYLEVVPAFSSVTADRRAVAGESLGHALSAVISSWLRGELPVHRDDLEALLAGLVPDWVMNAGAR